jgi:uncharacterized repeat protein (TIGR03809 family)
VLPIRSSVDIIKDWKVLAEKRLAHLSELSETGRWRRYHTEAAFLENLREAESVVKTWRALVASQPVWTLPAPTDQPSQVEECELSDVPAGQSNTSALKQRYPKLFTALLADQLT